MFLVQDQYTFWTWRTAFILCVMRNGIILYIINVFIDSKFVTVEWFEF